MNGGPYDERAARRTAALVVETAELRAAMVRLTQDGELLSQMATLVQDGSAEYERAVEVLRKIRKARDLPTAKRLADAYLREI